MKSYGMFYIYVVLKFVSTKCMFANDQSCTEIRFSRDSIGHRLDGYIIYTFNTDSLTKCLYECSVVTHCLSVNYDNYVNICELNSANSTTINEADFIANDTYIYTDIHAWTQLPVGECIHKPCPGKELCMPSTPPVCLEMVCADSPPAVAGAVINPTGVYYMGDTLSYMCSSPETYIIGDHTIRCGRFGKWTSPQFLCKRPETCAELKLCSPTSTSDGENWLFPSVLAGQKVKVFCRNMATDSPTEFITVNPSKNKVHSGGTDAGGDSYTTEFSKIRINPLTMEVIRSNTAYASRTDTLPYAEGADCVCPSIPCMVAGSFIVDTSDTGLIVDPNLNWSTYGWQPRFEDWYRNGQVISTTCGGYCGGCKPDGPMSLHINTAEVIPESSAVMPSCRIQ